MKLKKLIGKHVIRNKPKNLPGSSRGYWDFSFMTSPIEILDVGTNYIFYKNIYPQDSWMRKDPKWFDFVNKIETMDISNDDGCWEEFNAAHKEHYLDNSSKWHQYYEKTYPDQIRAIQQAW